MVRSGVRAMVVKNKQLKVSSRRIRVFMNKGIVCVTCQRVGRYYAIEKQPGCPGRFRLNLYTACGMMMTQDHIRPSSKGGTNAMDNLQPMCAACNNAKGDKYECESSS